MRKIFYYSAAFFLLVFVVIQAVLAKAQDSDLALALGIDVSYSVDAHEFQIQLDGIANALMSEEFDQALSGLALGRIWVSLYQWSREDRQELSLDWYPVTDKASAQTLASKIMTIKRHNAYGATSLSGALQFGVAQILRCPCSPLQRTIDISGDGRQNNGKDLQRYRDLALVNNITINGLAIVHEDRTLDIYFERQLIAGDGAFVEKAENYDDYRRAILKKLLRELPSGLAAFPQNPILLGSR